MKHLRAWRTGMLAAAGLMVAVATATADPKDPPKPEPRPVERPATFEIRLPADAVLEINGYKTTSTGSFRRFESPPLPIGKNYTYLLKATWRDQVVEKEITVTPDRVMAHDLRPEFKVSSPALMPGLGMEFPARVDLKGGEKKSFVVKVSRRNLKGEVELQFTGLPKGVTIESVKVPEDKDSATVEVVCDKDCMPGRTQITIHAHCGTVKSSGTMMLSIANKVPIPERPPVE
jgi:uncharacterized protein (TIGR03000 family)